MSPRLLIHIMDLAFRVLGLIVARVAGIYQLMACPVLLYTLMVSLLLLYLLRVSLCYYIFIFPLVVT